MHRPFVILSALAFTAWGYAQAQEPSLAPPVGAGELRSLSVFPHSALLRGGDQLQQLVITGHYANGGIRDVTASATYRVLDEKVARVDRSGLLTSIAGGTSDVVVEFEGQSIAFRVSVTAAEEPRRLNFTNDIVPIFSKLGCNAGACHGKSSGQNGFKLSLLGFEPEIDFNALTREGRGRRVFPAAVARSLLLTKPSGTVPHGGGVRLPVGSRDYKTIASWILAGMPYGDANDPVVAGITVAPHHRLIGRESTQQITVTAHYSDGTTRDATADAEYHSNDPELLDVSPTGLVRTNHLPGEGAAMVRYLGHVAVFRATIPLARAGDGSKAGGGAGSTTLRAQTSNFIDEHVAAKLDQLGMVPSEMCTDGEFLRRASVDICGTLPTADEAREFLDDHDPNKREKLVDRLLQRPEYASYFALKWGDILRNRQRGLVNVGGGSGRTQGMHKWIRDSLEANMPYDAFVRELLTARGSMYEKEGHPAVGWFTVLRTPQAMVDDTAQVFLGTRIQCAQCHHHPYEKWSQDDYWGMAAFFARLKLEKPKDKPPQGFTNAENIVVLEEGSLTNPQGKAYAEPRALGGSSLAIAKGADPREQLAQWLTDRENPFFARALVNRYWGHFFGRGIVDAADDMRVTNPPSHPELLDALAKEFVDSGFDLKHVVRAIATSKTYQRSSLPNETNAKAGRSFARFQPRRLSAEVLLDGIDQFTGSPTPYGGNSPVARAIELPDETVPLRGGYNGNFLEVFGKPARDSACECERVTAASLAQSLYMIGSEEIHRKLKGNTSRAARLAADERPLTEKIDELFLSAFARRPTPGERQAAETFLAEELAPAEMETSPTQRQLRKQAAYEDLIWALVNTKEFLFNH